jgi:hypothetical protein
MAHKKFAVYSFETPTGKMKIVGSNRGPDFIQERYLRVVKTGPLLDPQKTPIRYATKAPALDPSNYSRPLSVEEYFRLLMKRRPR